MHKDGIPIWWVPFFFCSHAKRKYLYIVMLLIYILLFLFLLSLANILRWVILIKSRMGEKTDEKKEGDVTVLSTGRQSRKISSSLGKYVDFKEHKNK